MMMEEMNHVMKRMLAQCAGSTGALLISYLLSSYLFFDLHGMKSFLFYLLCAGVAVSAVAAFFHAGILSAAAAVGYIAGFFCGMAFGSVGTDPGGGRTCSGWLIWGGIFFGCLLIGAVLQLVRRGGRKPDG